MRNAVLYNFSRGISVILTLNCSILVFSEPTGCGFLTFLTVLQIILQVLQRFPSLFHFPFGKGSVIFCQLVANGCNLLCLFCLNQKLPNLNFINKFAHCYFQSSGLGMTLRFHSIYIAVLRYLAIF